MTGLGKLQHPPIGAWKLLKLGYIKVYHRTLSAHWFYYENGCSHIDLKDIVDIQLQDYRQPQRRVVTLSIRGRKPLTTLMRRGEATALVRTWMKWHR